MSDGRWHVHANGSTIGPMSWTQLVELSQGDQVGPNATVWREGATYSECLSDVLSASGSVLAAEVDGDDARPAESVSARDETRNATVTTADGWRSRPVAPWRRYGARMIDTLFNGYFGNFVFFYVWVSIAPRSAMAFLDILTKPLGVVVLFVMVTVASAAVGGILVGLSGSSLGKWIFGVRVLTPDLGLLGVRNGLRREFKVWLCGLGFGIPLFTIVTMLFSYKSLSETGSTIWDDGINIVVHRPSSEFQTLLNIIGIVIIVLLNVWPKLLAR